MDDLDRVRERAVRLFALALQARERGYTFNQVLWNPGWGCGMTTASEFREYAKECLAWADEAETDEQRQSFLDLARDWTLAAPHLEGRLGQNDLLSRSSIYVKRHRRVPLSSA